VWMYMDFCFSFSPFFLLPDCSLQLCIISTFLTRKYTTDFIWKYILIYLNCLSRHSLLFVSFCFVPVYSSKWILPNVVCSLY
jgi:hypothetical protein